MAVLLATAALTFTAGTPPPSGEAVAPSTTPGLLPVPSGLVGVAVRLPDPAPLAVVRAGDRVDLVALPGRVTSGEFGLPAMPVPAAPVTTAPTPTAPAPAAPAPSSGSGRAPAPSTAGPGGRTGEAVSIAENVLVLGAVTGEVPVLYLALTTAQANDVNRSSSDTRFGVIVRSR